MLANVKTNTGDDFLNDGGDDNLLDDEGQKPQDIITHGEKISENLKNQKHKCVNPNVLGSQIDKLLLTFDEGIIKNL